MTAPKINPYNANSRPVTSGSIQLNSPKIQPTTAPVTARTCSTQCGVAVGQPAGHLFDHPNVVPDDGEPLHREAKCRTDGPQRVRPRRTSRIPRLRAVARCPASGPPRQE